MKETAGGSVRKHTCTRTLRLESDRAFVRQLKNVTETTQEPNTAARRSLKNKKLVAKANDENNGAPATENNQQPT